LHKQAVLGIRFGVASIVLSGLTVTEMGLMRWSVGFVTVGTILCAGDLLIRESREGLAEAEGEKYGGSD
jgi:uncharacterized membrane protein